MDYMPKLANISQRHGGIITTNMASNLGISKAMLSKLCKDTKIYRIAQGQYVLYDDLQDELLSISNRSSKIIFSHETALFLHGLSDRTPFEYTASVPTNYTASPTMRANCKFHYIKPDLYPLGKTELITPFGNMVPVYDLERTICDIVRSRNKIGTETFLSALKLYAACPHKDLNKLNFYAQKLHVKTLMRQYLEVLL